MDKEQLRTAIGPRADFYLRRFETFASSGRQWTPSWNWPAFFFSTAWFSWRRMDGYGIANFFLPIPFVLSLYIASHEGEKFWAIALVAIYIAVAYVLVPVYANALYHRHLQAQLRRAAEATERAAAKPKSLPRPPSIWTLLAAILSGAFAFVLAVIFLVAPAAYSDYMPRAKVSEGVSIAAGMRNEIAEFHVDKKRLPNPQEAERFRFSAPMKYTESVAYDAERKMIIVTMRDSYSEGKRFAMHAIEKEGALTWSCRTIDLPRKYLPGACRD